MYPKYLDVYNSVLSLGMLGEGGEAHAKIKIRRPAAGQATIEVIGPVL